MTANTTTEHHRYLVLGAGPAGLQLGCFLQAAGCDYVVLEREDVPGGFFRRYPRHRRLISLNKVHTLDDDPEIRLRWDWNSLLSPSSRPLFAEYSSEWFPHADAMVAYLTDYQRAHVPAVRFGTDVREIARTDTGSGFRLRAADGRVFTGDCLIVATGWGGPYVPDIPGIEHAVGYEDAPVVPEAYRGKRVLFIGKGNSAFERHPLARPRRADPPRLTAADAPGVAQQAPRRRARTVRRTAGRLLVQNPARRPGMRDRTDPPGRRRLPGVDRLHARRR
ncbi:NAD(P)-binding domain-containing protein [Saccharothrix sp. ALI-22-I]|uniref:NAD(P)-binding domain-containing protein n=1 Tax=Saccharothrix sp. ALI-22-I TaxID=1933778 RepID=UPI001930EA54|nr:NAD(P)-binding domain-containing protein [Saccharothrix sp. ALI-22-I]